MNGERDLRVSDAEREHVTGLLERAVGQGLINLDEFTERTDRALAARTRGELNAVLTDLPGLVHHGPRGTVPARSERLELRNTMSSAKREGRWKVPHEIAVYNRVGSTELDFTEADIRHSEVRIELHVLAGSVELLLPASAGMSTSGVTVAAGTLDDETEFDGPSGTPRFVLYGTVRAGSVRIRTPRYMQVGPITVRWPWRLEWKG
ncbi:DUF1707 SHOCT-like domain-containing protein [Amycolatopsis suaedae]|uniref:DUF1707 and DUF2154 domain-containing protein n=1 Tax=Amycolatopsis suaedae TaxID=2510978 RepID=A0A4Q7JEC9_9PSEU|nr:DUF1707 domain-containing protein [Amycolatopsis suaedae]RZQ65043.1 DUF1707 and DUF2154 domain-containing protein [Amycolatopsis suaedae]